MLPDACVAVAECVLAGRHDEARAFQQRLVRLAALVSTIHGVAGLKAALDEVGFRGGPVRAPLQPATPAVRAEIAAALAAAGEAFRGTALGSRA